MYMKSMDPETCPMFNELLLLILRDTHIEDRMCEEGIAQEMW